MSCFSILDPRTFSVVAYQGERKKIIEGQVGPH